MNLLADELIIRLLEVVVVCAALEVGVAWLMRSQKEASSDD